MSQPDTEHDSYDPLIPVPQARRELTVRDAFSLWFSLGIGLLVLQAGALLVPGLSMAGALAAIVIGSLVGAGLLALAGVVGADSGLATIAVLRPVLGTRGAAMPAVLNIVQLAGWGAFEIVAMRDAANALAIKVVGAQWAGVLPVVWTLLFGAAATALAVMGPLGVVRRFLRHWGMWLLLAGAAWMSWALLAHHDLAALFARKGDGSLSLGGGIDIVAAMPLSWLPLIADYTRFGKSPGAMFKGSAGGYLLANLWFYSLGALYALAAKTDANGMLLSALAATGGGVALLLILIDETDNIFADIFSAATSTATLVRVRIGHLVMVFGGLCTLIALFVPMTQFQGFLYFIGSVFTPLYGVLLVDHFVIRRRAPGEASRGLRIGALVAWGAGIAAYYAIVSGLPALGATLPALAIAAVTYWSLRRLGL